MDSSRTRASGPPPSWFDTEVHVEEALIDQLIAEAASNFRDRPALVPHLGTAVTYGQVGSDANRVANLLASRGIGRGDFVGILADHRPETIVAIVGVLRAGASYVPFDPRWPVARVQALSSELRIRALVVSIAHMPAVDSIWPALPDLTDVICVDVARSTWESRFDTNAVRELWDIVADDEDPARAAGFNFRRPDEVSAADIDWYRHHVVGLVRDRLAGGSLLDIGCGAGFLTESLIEAAGEYVGVEPSTVAVERLRRDHPEGHYHVAFAHELDALDLPDCDMALLASTVQFFPDTSYLVEAVSQAARRIRPGGALIIADVIDPDREEHTGLRLASGFFDDLAERHPMLVGAEIIRRPAGGGRLAERYDVVLTRALDAAGSADDVRRLVHGWADVQEMAETDPALTGRSWDDVAYVIFTSGSTGKPKGVTVCHRSVVNLIDWVTRSYGVGPDDRLLFSTAFAFDLSVYDMFGLLAVGGSIYVVPDEQRLEPDHMADILASGEVTFWDSAPAALSAVLPFVRPVTAQAGSTQGPPRTGSAPLELARSGLRLVFLSGDWVPLSMHADLRARFPRAELIALGGATECTVWSNHFPVRHVDPTWRSVPYGKPMQNAWYYIVDEAAEWCPIEEPGELWIGGECVAAGYWGDAELTNRKFAADPWHGGRLYKTGDQAQWLPDGNIEFLGRIDDQVKIRGYRIELGEVSSALGHVPGVREAIVLALDWRDEKQLVAFYVPADEPPSPASVREQLRVTLPPYMVPEHLLALAAFPVGATGKVDRDALGRVWSDRLDADTPPQAIGDWPDRAPHPVPILYDCWHRVLGEQPASDRDDFFAVGGSSLLAARLAALIRERLDLPVTARTVFDAPTLGLLATVIRGLQGEHADA